MGVDGTDLVVTNVVVVLVDAAAVWSVAQSMRHVLDVRDAVYNHGNGPSPLSIRHRVEIDCIQCMSLG